MPRRHLSVDEQESLNETMRVCWRRKIALAVILSLIAIMVGVIYA